MSRRMELAARLLVRAAERIEEQGWTQATFGEVGGPRCASAALLDAIDEARPLNFNASDSAWVAMRNRTGHPKGQAFTWIMVWNDEPGRTKEEVLATFREAAAGLA